MVCLKKVHGTVKSEISNAGSVFIEWSSPGIKLILRVSDDIVLCFSPFTGTEKRKKKVSLGLEPMTSAAPVRCCTHRATKTPGDFNSCGPHADQWLIGLRPVAKQLAYYLPQVEALHPQPSFTHLERMTLRNPQTSEKKQGDLAQGQSIPSVLRGS